MANCPNCGAALSCGCQRKVASDGKQGCVQCIPAYEQRLKNSSNNNSGRQSNNGDTPRNDKPLALFNPTLN